MNNYSETQLGSSEEMPVPGNAHRWRWTILGVLLVAILAAAAFLGGSYLQKGSLALGRGDGMWISDGQTSRFISKGDILPAEELPKTEADANGVFVRRQDNSVFIGTGEIQLNIGQTSNDPGGTPGVVSNYDGPLVEVVTTASTQIYRDDTNLLSLASSKEKIQQKVVPGELGEIGQISLVSAWGRQTGDRLVADVILYKNPPIMNAPLK